MIWKIHTILLYQTFRTHQWLSTRTNYTEIFKYLLGFKIDETDCWWYWMLFLRRPFITWLKRSILTHWGRVTHIYIYASFNMVIICSDNGLLPLWHQAIIWTNAKILIIGPLGTNFSEILIGVQTFSFKKLHLKRSSAKWRLFYLGLNELKGMLVHKDFLTWLSILRSSNIFIQEIAFENVKWIVIASPQSQGTLNTVSLLSNYIIIKPRQGSVCFVMNSNFITI